MIEGLDRVIEETNQDCNALEAILTELEVKVLRPKQKAFRKEFHHPIMPRDIFGFYGNKMIQTYGAIHSRQEELDCYKEIVDTYKDKVFIKMGKPAIDETEETEYTEAHSNKVKVQQRYDKYKNMCLWEVANMIKCGEHILHTQSADKDPISGKGTEVGLQFMKDMLPEFKFVELPVGGHIDGKLALLRPGLLLTWRKEFIPDALKNWDAIIVKDKAQLPTAMENVATLHNAGIRVAIGTDTGPPARFQGYFEHMEMHMMVDAGMSPLDAIRSSTGVAADCIGMGDIGTLEPGKWGDFSVLTENPADDIRNSHSIESVYIAGNLVPNE